MNYFFDELPLELNTAKQNAIIKLMNVLEENDTFYIIPNDLCEEWLPRLKPLKITDLSFSGADVTYYDHKVYDYEIYSNSEMMYIQDSIQV